MQTINLIYLNMKDKLIEEKVLLKELNKIIKELDQEIYFSLNEPTEQRICLEKVKESWQVYFVERGIKHQIKEYENLYEACINVIDRLSPTNELSKYFTKEFRRILRKD